MRSDKKVTIVTIILGLIMVCLNGAFWLGLLYGGMKILQHFGVIGG